MYIVNSNEFIIIQSSVINFSKKFKKSLKKTSQQHQSEIRFFQCFNCLTLCNNDQY